ncbi:MAG: polyprenyl synthetase family protein [Elusimicrobiota bacterium]|jgi:octaprenyl-diphosphate synthase
MAAGIEDGLSRVREGLERRTARLGERVGDHLAAFVGRPGKMLRPRYTLLLGAALGVEPGRCERAACAAELLHNASLLHDDCVDRAELRRGNPTPNGLFGNTAGILLGDMAFAEGLEEAFSVGEGAARALVGTAREMASGELQEEFLRGSLHVSVEGYFGIAARKTAALFEWAGEALSGLSPHPHRREDPPKLGRLTGVLLQVIDDIHDLTLSSEVAGKERGQDFLLGKLTLPCLLALEDERLRPRFLSLWERKPRDRSSIEELVRFLHEEGCLEGTRNRARALRAEMDPLLDALPVQEHVQALRSFEDALLSREF